MKNCKNPLWQSDQMAMAKENSATSRKRLNPVLRRWSRPMTCIIRQSAPAKRMMQSMMAMGRLSISSASSQPAWEP